VHPYPSHAEIIRRAADEFAACTLPHLRREWSAMVRGRLARRRVRTNAALRGRDASDRARPRRGRRRSTHEDPR
jgi:hypothetical protein